MASKGMKPAIARPSARESLAAADSVAQAEGLPPAALARREASIAPLQVATEGDEQVQVNFRVRRPLADLLADRARADGVTQKVLICRALAAAGFDVAPDDLKAPPARRRRGSA